MATAETTKAEEIVFMLDKLSTAYKQTESRSRLGERIAVMASNLEGENINDVRGVLERWPHSKAKFPGSAMDVIREIRANSHERPTRPRKADFTERARELEDAALQAFDDSRLAAQAKSDGSLWALRRWVREVVSMQARTIARCEQFDMPVQPGRKDHASRTLYCLDEMQQAGQVYYTVPQEVIEAARADPLGNPWWLWQDRVVRTGAS